MGGPRCEGDKGHVPCPQGRPNPCTRGDRGWRRGTSALPSRSYHSTRIGGDRGENPLHPKATPTLAHVVTGVGGAGNRIRLNPNHRPPGVPEGRHRRRARTRACTVRHPGILNRKARAEEWGGTLPCLASSPDRLIAAVTIVATTILLPNCRRRHSSAIICVGVIRLWSGCEVSGLHRVDDRSPSPALSGFEGSLHRGFSRSSVVPIPGGSHDCGHEDA